jgi:hypothetical protein
MGHALIHLGNNDYIEWSTVVDAPVGYTLNRAEVVMACFGANASDRIERLDRNGHTWRDLPAQTPQQLVSCNRAGPRECCLTLAALRRRYASPEAYTAFEFTPSDVEPYTNYDDGIVYWVPWRPGEAPSVITADTDFHAQVPLTATELATLTAAG